MTNASAATAIWGSLTDHTAPPSISSRPVYYPLLPDTAASSHLLLIETEALKDGQIAYLAKTFGPVSQQLQVLVTGDNVSLPDATSFASLESTLLALDHALEQANMGQRVYALGSEPYLWSIYNAALNRGLDRLQVHLCHSGSLKRRVWCTHCHAFTENVTTNIVTCSHCARPLLVREHFSRRFGAFMGVQIDAEVPGEVPAIEEVFP
jgi:dimethylamine monooxygenase subunit C